MSTIHVTLGNARYVGGTITERLGGDISRSIIKMALGADDVVPPAGGWVAPDTDATGGSISTRTVKMLIASPLPVGQYYVWASITDAPEIEPVLLQGPIVVA